LINKIILKFYLGNGTFKTNFDKKI
jgi:hypothetical protein